jgi:glutamate N-acetyltransferase/amino-acid N-acetyltransferase
MATPGAAQLRALGVRGRAELAQAIVRDGEGATKFISITVEQAGTLDEASVA